MIVRGCFDSWENGLRDKLLKISLPASQWEAVAQYVEYAIRGGVDVEPGNSPDTKGKYLRPALDAVDVIDGATASCKRPYPPVEHCDERGV